MSTVESSAMARLFFALWPNDVTLWQLLETKKRLETLRAHWVTPEKLHLTLVFLGEVEAARISDLTAAAEEIDCPAFQLHFDRLELWQKTQLLCMTPRDPPESVFSLVAALQRMLKHKGFKQDNRRYRPHLTLARRVRARILPEDAAVEPVDWRAESFCLVESQPDAGGSRYAVRQAWPLRG